MGSAWRGMESSDPSFYAMVWSAGFLLLPWCACLTAGLESQHLETPFSTLLEYITIKIELNLLMTPDPLWVLQEEDEH